MSETVLVRPEVPQIAIPAIAVRTGPWERQLGALVAERGWRRVALVCGTAFARATGLPDALRAALPAAEVLTWADGTPHAPVASVEAAAAALRPFGPDVIVSAGGGSSHDLAKGVAVLLERGGRLLDHTLTFDPPDDLRPHPLPGEKVPIVTIPTTLSGAEANGAAGYATEGGKRVLADLSLTPTAVLVDGELAAATPREIYLGSVMNAVNHCVEGLASRRSSLFTTALFRSGLGELAAVSESLAASGLDAASCERAGVASALIGVGLPGSWLGLAHAIGHVIGGVHGVPHGWCHAVIAPAVVRFNAGDPAAARAHADAARVLSLDDGDSAALAAWLRATADAFALPATLSDLGVTPDAIPALADAAWRDHDSFYNPRRITGPREIEGVLEGVVG
ncbi:MAG TPA: iron-containing alcohol dehydrogenase [Conexibacter sp.]|jgi:alcohol dehydrogenase class IV